MSKEKMDEILDFAIGREQEAHDFYADLSRKAEREHMKGVFSQFAQEEMGHKKKLEGIKRGKRDFPQSKKVMDLKLADYLVEVKAEEKTNVGYQDALILAMKREKASFKLYTDMAAMSEDAGWKETFLGLAQEEAKHKLRFEIEYDDAYLRDN